MTYGELVGRLVQEGLDRHDPGRRGSRRAGASAPNSPTKPARAITSAPRERGAGRSIPQATKRQVWQRDGGGCSYVDRVTGQRCTSRHLLQMDHIQPYALGGGADPDNLRLLCAAHHRHRHAARAAAGEPAQCRPLRFGRLDVPADPPTI